MRFLLLTGRPLREPIARYGPFVMNTSEEIIQAIRDYQRGTFLGKGRHLSTVMEYLHAYVERVLTKELQGLGAAHRLPDAQALRPAARGGDGGPGAEP